MTARAGATGSPGRPSPAAPPDGDPGEVEAAALVDELTAVVGGARHEARFIVDEALVPLARWTAGHDGAGRRGGGGAGHGGRAGRRGSRCSTSSATGPSAPSTCVSTPGS